MIETIEKLGKVPIVTADVECFAADDIFCNYISEAARIVEEGLATPAQVDAIVNDAIGGGGPFNVMDLTRGNLLTAQCQELMQNAPTGTPWFAPPADPRRSRATTPWHDRKKPGDPRARRGARARRCSTASSPCSSVARYFVVEQDIATPIDTNWLTRMALGFTKGLARGRRGARRGHACTSSARATREAHPGFPVPKLVAEQQAADASGAT